MIKKTLLFEILREQNYWFKQPLFDYIDRKTYLKEIKKHIDTKSILVIQGPRRAGKTVLLKLLIREMMKSIDKNKILYVNLEDYRLFQYYSLELIEAIYDTYREKINPDKEVYYFIDEIQNIDGFEHYLRSQYDSEKKIKFIITGSNSKLLSKELATLLTGRTLTFKVFPFSFKEYLSYKNMEISDNKYYSLEPNIHKLKHLFNDYYTLGSIPEYINNPEKERLEEYFENVILKDIVERYNIRNTKLIKDLGIYLLSNATSLISHGSLSKVFDVSINTIKEYISFLKSAYLFFHLNKFSYSYKKQLKTSSKIYSIDNGLINLVSFKFSENKGRLFENLVFLELKRNNKEIYYHRLKKECDFIIKKNLKITNAIQVSISLDLPKTKKREYEGLIEALNEYNLKEGLIITEDQYEDLKIDEFKIKIRPLWFWLLNKTE